MYSAKAKSADKAVLLFLPTEIIKIKHTYLHGEIEQKDETISIYVTGICQKMCDLCIGDYATQDFDDAHISSVSNNRIHIRRDDFNFKLRELKGENKFSDNVGIIVIYYDRQIFIDFDNSLFCQRTSVVPPGDHFRGLIKKLQYHKKEKQFVLPCNKLIAVLRSIFVFLLFICKMLCIVKHSSILLHIDNYLVGLVWMIEPRKTDKREHIKKLNFFLSIIIDVILGAIILDKLNDFFPSDSFPTSLLSGETVVRFLKDLIHWLTGDPAGFKLNYTFSKLLATFFLFYIDIWCAFLAILKPAYKMIILVFFMIGRAGITFQVSILEDIVTVLTFHIYCICLFAAKLYNIQISALIALWRLFLGRKKNPLRRRVDSCKYTPEQLFMGTLGFTILLFLLPTTLIYYIVFTFLRLILMSCKGTLSRIRYVVQSIQIYSIILRLIGSAKICTGIKLVPIKSNSDCFIFQAKPVCSSFRKIVMNDKPDFLRKPEEFKFFDFLYSLLTGGVMYS